MLSRIFSSLLAGSLLTLAAGVATPVQAQVLDQIIFGNPASEIANGFSGTRVSAPTNNQVTGDSFRYIFRTPMAPRFLLTALTRRREC